MKKIYNINDRIKVLGKTMGIIRGFYKKRGNTFMIFRRYAYARKEYNYLKKMKNDLNI